jgi:hypothetical protein
MKKQLQILILLLLSSLAYPQVWTPPVDISNTPGLDNQPDLCIDKNGTIHCVWTHKIDNNWRKIYYSKSTDNGISWSTSEDISLNNSLSMMDPQIVADTNNHLYVTYSYNTGDEYNTQVYLKILDWTTWSNPINLTPNQPGAHGARMAMDQNGKLYCFWYYGASEGNTFYRYLANDVWSSIICPYPGNHYLALVKAIADKDNNIHCLGSFHDYGMSHQDDRNIYFKYEANTGNWSEKILISPPTSITAPSSDITIDDEKNPYIAYRQKNPYSLGNNDDSTMYIYYKNNNWTVPELVVSDPDQQKIAIDDLDKPHIIDCEKLGTKTKMVHYQKADDLWQGYVIDSANISIGQPNLLYYNHQLLLMYNKCPAENDGDIYFTTYDIVSGVKELPPVILGFKIYPNPGRNPIMIDFSIGKQEKIEVSIYDLNGRQIITLINEDKTPGRYQTLWNGRDQNGKEVNSGLYLVRLQWGRNSVTRPVEYSKQ